MKLHSHFLLAAACSFMLFSCGDDDEDIAPKPGDTPSEIVDEDKPEPKDEYSTDKYDEGKIAFFKGTNMNVDATSDGTIDYVWFNAPANTENKIVYKTQGEDWLSVNDNTRGDNGQEHYAYIYISENKSNSPREADVVFYVGDYKKAVHIRQRAAGDLPGEQTDSYFKTNFWSRTDREKLGLFGPVKYLRDYSHSPSEHFNNEYFFDEEGRLTKMIQNGTYGFEYKYNSKGQRIYCKTYTIETGITECEEYWEYNNTGRMTYQFLYIGNDMVVPELSQYRKEYNPVYQDQKEVTNYTFTDDDKLKIEDIIYLGNYQSESSKVVELKNGKVFNYNNFNDHGEGRGIGNVSFHPNGMFATLTYTYGTVYGFEYRQEQSFRFANYDGSMLIEHYEDIQPDYPNSENNLFHDYFYNSHKDLKEIHIKKVGSADKQILYTGYLFDSHGNWTHRDLSDSSWGSQYSYIWFVDCADRLIEYYSK